MKRLAAGERIPSLSDCRSRRHRPRKPWPAAPETVRYPRNLERGCLIEDVLFPKKSRKTLARLRLWCRFRRGLLLRMGYAHGRGEGICSKTASVFAGYGILSIHVINLGEYPLTSRVGVKWGSGRRHAYFKFRLVEHYISDYRGNYFD